VAEGNAAEGALSADDLRRLEEELQKVKVADILVQTMYTLSSLAFGRLMPDGRDLDQARLAIDAIGALMPVLEGSLPTEATRDFNQVRANLQLAYASAVAEQSSAGAPETDTEDTGKEDAGDD
jgi:hypothetical protein